MKRTIEEEIQRIIRPDRDTGWQKREMLKLLIGNRVEEVTKCEECWFREQDGAMTWCSMGGSVHKRALYEEVPDNCPLLKGTITVKYRNHE